MQLIKLHHPSPNSTQPQKLFTCITKLKKQEELRMLETNDTEHQSQLSTKYELIRKEIDKQVSLFKKQKAAEIAEISLEAGSNVKTVANRLQQKNNEQLLSSILSAVERALTEDKKILSVQRNMRSPKELGSTIEHTYTPESIDTPAFDFQESEIQAVNEFSIKSNEFTLNPKSNSTKRQTADVNDRVRTVSEFNIGQRNPTSKRIKDKIMNSKKFNS